MSSASLLQEHGKNKIDNYINQQKTKRDKNNLKLGNDNCKVYKSVVGQTEVNT